MSGLLYLGLFLPLLGFFILSAFSYQIGRLGTGVIACVTILFSFLSFLLLLAHYVNAGMHPQQFDLYSWIPLKGINSTFSLHLDSLSLLMALIITGVGFLIHVYSNGYMEYEEDYGRYFAFLNFFVFSMLLFVLAADLLLLFVGWEGVGLASYLLIGFWYAKPSAAQAATKAFVMNRIGDLGLLLGIIFTIYLFGTSNIAEVLAQAKQQFGVGSTVLTVLTLLYFIGATGKSAQLPLYSWLPDAMEGPTPVSALIHAATMVTAGVYLVVRMSGLFLLAPLTLQVIGIVGGATALFAALCALSQTDLKRVLAYSTVSQLGLMFLACGAGAFYSAMFHLTTHAFIKALLFLSAGNVVHMLHDVTEMDQMGGLAQKLSKTSWFFLIGLLALSGVPPLAAFFSKDLILEQEYLAGYETLFFIALIASILTGCYLTRAYCLTFFGETHVGEEEWKNLKEAPKVMLIPVALLALLSIVGGFLGYTFGKAPLLQEFLKGIAITPSEAELHSGFVLTPETWMAVIGGLLGIGIFAWLYTKWLNRLGAPIALFRNSFYVDEIYDTIVVKPLKECARLISYYFEPQVFDGFIRGVVQTTQGCAGVLQQLQSGQIRSYLAWLVAGSVLLILYLLL